MMGRLKRDQGQFFYSFCLDEVVPADHRVREIASSWHPILCAGSTVDRSGAHASNADRRLCVRDPLGAIALS